MNTSDFLNGTMGRWYEVKTSLGISKVMIESAQTQTPLLKYFDISKEYTRDKRVQIIEDMINYAISEKKEIVGFQNSCGKHRVFIDVLETEE